jgi:tetratricopeptide (TPR) repeat protein
MANLISSSVIALSLAGLAAPAFPADPPPATSSTTVIGGNELLQEGAAEMRVGNWQRGVELTLEGLKRPNAQHDVAAALSNLCAGYVGLRQFELALKSCDDSLAINDSNWRTWNNRAAAHLGKGMYDAALQDVETGLERAPASNTLKKTRAIVLERQRAREQLQRDALRT